ncbi:MAG: preprotein translocase subunit YajC [Thermodesulfobacteriota bacterium]
MLYFFPVAVAYAAPAAAGKPSAFASMAPLVLLFVVFYFLLIRPQQKKAKESKEMLSKVEKGDNVITTGGIYGIVTKVTDDTLTVEIADNVRVKLSKNAISARKTHDN